MFENYFFFVSGKEARLLVPSKLFQPSLILKMGIKDS
jgi:hypothetical protein